MASLKIKTQTSPLAFRVSVPLRSHLKHILGSCGSAVVGIKLANVPSA